MVVDLANVKNQVIVVGAGALENEENFAALKALGIIVWMDVDSKEVARRLMADQKALESRPLFPRLSPLPIWQLGMPIYLKRWRHCKVCVLPSTKRLTLM